MPNPYTVTYDDMAAYAAILLSVKDPYKAAKELGKNGGEALYYATVIAKDHEFKLIFKAHADENTAPGEDPDLPTDADIIKRAWQMANYADEEKEQMNALKLLADIRGLTKKDQQPVNVHVNNKTLMIPLAASLDDWEKQAQKQQAELLNVAETRH